MENPIIKPGTVTRIGELIEAENKTYGEETRERNARERRWKKPEEETREPYRPPLIALSFGDLLLFLTFFGLCIYAFQKFLNYLDTLNPI